jgi:uncharacterized protein YybS (DUF2232 family)
MGSSWGLLTLGLVVILVHSLFGAAGSGWMWVIQWAAMGPIFVVAMKRSRTVEKAMVAAVLATVGLQCLLLFARSIEGDIAPWTLVQKSIETSIRRAIQVYGEVGLVPEGMSFSQETVTKLAHAMMLMAPGCIIAMDLLLYWWTLLVHRKFPALCGIQSVGPGALRSWGLSYPWVWVTIFGGVLVVLPGGILGLIGINLLIVMGTLHLLQGIGVISTLFHERGVPPFIRGIFYVLLCFQQVILLGVIILGLFDVWFNFRKRWAPSSEDH